ncbi:MAG: hypothetical protein ACI93N_002234 [Flavobacteriaceae bacterium]|jgi:hypothetical protein
MVISHKYKYVFIETPQTGCSAIRNELIENYSGELILSKHSVYSHFLAIASSEEKKYFVFSSIRNPLDKCVSTFLKYKTNHNNRFTNKIVTNWRKALFQYRDRVVFKKVISNDFAFIDYLKIIKPYDDISTLDHRNFGFIIRFETLNNDFIKVLKILDINPKRNLPKFNSTATKKDFNIYYKDLEVQKLAFNKLAVFMDYWDYKFPSYFPNNRISLVQNLQWKVNHVIRIFTWRHLRKRMK